MTKSLEFFATDDAVAALEATLAPTSKSLDEVARTEALVALAWQMRQRDTKRALTLAEEAERRLSIPAGAESVPGSTANLASNFISAVPQDAAAHPYSETERQRLAARLMLIRAEAKWLLGEIDASKALAESALHGFGAFGDMPDDALGSADAHWLLAWLAVEQGDLACTNAELLAMTAAATDIDPVRSTMAQATMARFAAFSDVSAATERWNSHLSHDAAALHPATASAIEDFWGAVAMLSSDFVQSIRHWSNTYSMALASGQQRRAMVAALNVGVSFASLNDHQAALEWMRRGLDLARPTGWPGMVGMALFQTAHTLHRLQRLDAAADILEESLALMAPLSASRNYCLALHYLGDVEFDRLHYARALESYRLLEQRAVALSQADLLSDAQRGQARALLELGQAEPALQAAEAALHAAKSDASGQIAALRVMADIHTRHQLPPPAGMSATSAPLHYLHLALDAAADIENFTIPGDLLEAAAQAYANVGETGKAFELAKQAIAAREKLHSAEASNRASAIQVSHETEKARAEGEHHRQLALAHAERAKTLEQANSTLEELGQIGRNITGNLEAGAIFAGLHQHVHGLLNATTFIVYRLEENGQTLKLAFGVEAGLPVSPFECQLDDPVAPVARCARERLVIVLDAPPAPSIPLPGTRATVSKMFAPLLVGERLLGVMAIHCLPPHAYFDREIAIFRTLCAYGAIALVNAEAQAQLVETNKLLEILSISDRLTGLVNRLRLDLVLGEELARSKRSGAPLSVILFDVDHFKSVNDTHGHQVGDQVLVAVANLLRDGSREIDVVGRWGGEEFLIICRETELDGAARLAEKMRGSLASYDFPVAGKKTGSFGVATLGEDGNIDALIARADAALYRAKNAGRNRVEIGN